MAFQYATVNLGGMSTHYHARSLKNMKHGKQRVMLLK